ncbi:hypothetical protein [Bacillus cereus]|nr:hypothetical protein [Bacillus cereus]
MKIGTSEWPSLNKDIKLKLIRLAVIDSKYKQTKYKPFICLTANKGLS